MDALRHLAWWGMAYGSIACLWMTAQVKADLRGQPESSDGEVTTVYYGPAVPLAFAEEPASPPDHTILVAGDADGAARTGN